MSSRRASRGLPPTLPRSRVPGCRRADRRHALEPLAVDLRRRRTRLDRCDFAKRHGDHGAYVGALGRRQRQLPRLSTDWRCSGPPARPRRAPRPSGPPIVSPSARPAADESSPRSDRCRGRPIRDVAVDVDAKFGRGSPSDDCTSTTPGMPRTAATTSVESRCSCATSGPRISPAAARLRRRVHRQQGPPSRRR